MPGITRRVDITPILDKYIDQIVKEIDYDIWKEGYNIETAEEPEFVDEYRDEIAFILELFLREVNSQ